MTRQIPTDLPHIPAERPLPDKQQVLARILVDDAPLAPRPFRSRRWLTPAVAAASIAVIAGGALLIAGLNRSNGEPAGQSSAGKSAGTSGARDISIDRGSLTPAQAKIAARQCLAGLTRSSGPVPIDRILHPVKVARAGSRTPVPTLVVRSGQRWYTCLGPEKPNSIWDFSTHRRPLEVHLNPTGFGGIAHSGTLDQIFLDSWTAVDPGVATVRRRIIIHGQPGPWYTTKAVDGLAFIHAWDGRDLHLGDKIAVQTEQLDPTGHRIGPLAETTTAVKPTAPDDDTPTLEVPLR
jgi:hypothetical protein